MSKAPDYFIWFLLITAGVCVGNLAAHVISFVAVTEWTEYQLAQLQKEQNKGNVELREQRFEAQAERQAQLMDERESTPKGRELRRICQEWDYNYKRMPTPTLRLERDERCNAYRKYVWSGGD